jgi:hypothetical protein
VAKTWSYTGLSLMSAVATLNVFLLIVPIISMLGTLTLANKQTIKFFNKRAVNALFIGEI